MTRHERIAAYARVRAELRALRESIERVTGDAAIRERYALSESAYDLDVAQRCEREREK